jgi:hypothetical protein
MKVLIFQRGGRGEHVREGIERHGDGFDVRAVGVPRELPQIIDEPESFIRLPEDFEPDLVLDYLYQNELSQYLVERASEKGIPVIVPGRRVEGAVSPRTCCTLSLGALGEGGKSDVLEEYVRRFGIPDIDLVLDGEGKVRDVEVKRGAPCGSTWQAAEKVVGLDLEEAISRFALEVQYNCRAPTGYDPVLVKKPPLHIAADVHGEAFKKAVHRQEKST